MSVVSGRLDLWNLDFVRSSWYLCCSDPVNIFALINWLIKSYVAGIAIISGGGESWSERSSVPRSIIKRSIGSIYRWFALSEVCSRTWLRYRYLSDKVHPFRKRWSSCNASSKRTERAQTLECRRPWNRSGWRDIDDAAKRVVARQRSLTVLVSIITGTPCGELIFSFTGHLLHRGELSPLILLEEARVSDLDDRLLLPTLEITYG